MEIDGTPLAEGSVFFVAEAGVNHNGDLGRAEDLVDAAAEAGADAVKFQTFAADRLVAEDAPTADYQDEGAEHQDERTDHQNEGADQQDERGDHRDEQTDQQDEGTDDGTSQRELLEPYELDAADHRRLRDYCEEAGVTFLSTPFDRENADLLDDLGVPAVKIGSGDLTNHPLLRHVARFGRPMIVSTGMATLAEVEAAYGAIRAANPEVEVCLLHCVSSYPAAMADANLAAMETLDEQFPVPVGYSDHTTAVETPAMAVGAGARVVEKHFTLDRTLPGPDHEASLEPDELARAVELAREAATARGTPAKVPVEAEAETRTVARKSLHAARPVERGETITCEAVSILRPAEGLSPAALDATVSAAATLGEGVTVNAQSYVGPGATLGDHVLVDSAVNVSHDATLGDGATVAPNATLAGGVAVGRDAFVGAGATVRDHVEIGEGAKIGAGAVVVEDVPPETTVVGVPAEPME